MEISAVSKEKQLNLVTTGLLLPLTQKLCSLNSDGCSTFLPNYVYMNQFSSFEKKPRVGVKMSLGSSYLHKAWSGFNKLIRFHCERIPIGFASVHPGLTSDDSDKLGEDVVGDLKGEGSALNGANVGKPKNVLILMSDTGGGHRASAEAIRVAFNEEFGDQYKVSFLVNLL